MKIFRTDQKSDFDPVKLEITIETRAELAELWARLSCPLGGSPSSYCGVLKCDEPIDTTEGVINLFGCIDEAAEERGLV